MKEITKDTFYDFIRPYDLDDEYYFVGESNWKVFRHADYLESFKKQTNWFKYKDRAEYKNIVLDYSKYNEKPIEEYEELQPAAWLKSLKISNSRFIEKRYISMDKDKKSGYRNTYKGDWNG